MRLIIEGTTAEIIKILQGLERSVGEKTGEACRETYIPSIAQNTDPKELFIHGTTVACNGFDPAKLTNYKQPYNSPQRERRA